MKRFTLPGILSGMLCALLIALFSACSSGSSADMHDILSTVPSDAGLVAGIDLASIIDEAGGKVDGSKVELPDGVSKSMNADPGTFKTLSELCEGQAGVSLTAVVFFTEGAHSYVTGLLDDPDKFRSYVSGKLNLAFKSVEGVDCCGFYAVKGNRFWIEQHRSIDGADVARFDGLGEKQSFLSNKYAETLCKMEHPVEVFSDINSLLTLVDGSSAATMRIAISACFKDACYATVTVAFDKRECKVDMNLLDSDFKPSEFLLPSGKVNADIVKGLDCSAPVFMGIALPGKLMKKVVDLAASFGGGLPAEYTDMLKAIDGTLALAINPDDSAFKGVVETTGEGTADLVNALNMAVGAQGNVERDGKKLLLTTTKPLSGPITADKASSDLKGSIFAICADVSKMKDTKNDMPFDFASVKAEPDGKSIKAEIRMIQKSGDSDSFIANCIKNMAGK